MDWRGCESGVSSDCSWSEGLGGPEMVATRSSGEGAEAEGGAWWASLAVWAAARSLASVVVEKRPPVVG